MIGRNIPQTCANIEYTGISLQTLRAGFNSSYLNGEVILRRQNGRSGMTFNVNLYSGCNGSVVGPGPLSWSLNRGKCDMIGEVSVCCCIFNWCDSVNIMYSFLVGIRLVKCIQEVS